MRLSQQLGGQWVAWENVMRQLGLAFCCLSLFASSALAAGDFSPNVPDTGAPPPFPVAQQCPCPPESGPEGEPNCFDGYVDNFNGGCNSTPVVYSVANCSPICGNTGVYDGGRDTDWYQITLGAGNFTFSARGDGFTVQYGIFRMSCPPGVIYNVFAPPCVAGVPLLVTGPGTFVIFVTCFPDFPMPPCGSKYTLTISGPGIPSCGTTPVESSTWGLIKSRYE